MVKNSSPKKNRQAKKEIVVGKNKTTKRPNALLLIVAIAAVAGAVGAAYFITSGAETGEGNPRASVEQSAGASEIHHPVSLFSDGQARHFEHRVSGITVRYFILKSSDGIIRAAFDACDVCWPSGKGYYQDGDVMVCRNCGRQFASIKVNEVKGGCNPAPLNRAVQGDQLVIKTEDLLQGKQYFDFKGKV